MAPGGLGLDQSVPLDQGGTWVGQGKEKVREGDIGRQGGREGEGKNEGHANVNVDHLFPLCTLLCT